MFLFSFNTAKTGKIVTEDGSDRLAVLKESGEYGADFFVAMFFFSDEQ